MSLEIPRLILASGSAGRKAMMQNAGLQFDIIPADIDEESITENLQKNKISAENITSELATQKALHISKKNPDALVIGCDQTLVFEDYIFSKAKNKNEAIKKLNDLRGKTHILNSAVAVAHKNNILWKIVDSAQLSMIQFDDKFLDTYVEHAKNALTSCVGGYQIEGIGAWLFSEIKGDVFTIMGMPLLPLLSYLRTEHGITP